MIKTKNEITMKFGEGRPAMGGSIHDITIPAGTRVSETGDGQYFVEDISFLDRNSMAYHDANYYGIRLNADQVERRCSHGKLFGESCPECGYVHPSEQVES